MKLVIVGSFGLFLCVFRRPQQLSALDLVGAAPGVWGSLYVSLCVRNMLQKTNSMRPVAGENVFVSVFM